MKILWVHTNFLLPAQNGGAIRTLNLVRRLRQRHEVHYVAQADRQHLALAESSAMEYCSAAHAVERDSLPARRSLAFAREVVANLLHPLPLSVARYRSPQLMKRVQQLRASVRYDAVVVDHLGTAVNMTELSGCVLFQHNVEAQLWRRHAEQAPHVALQRYFRLQAGRMARFEQHVCSHVSHVLAVSNEDARLLRQDYGLTSLGVVPNAVDADYYLPGSAEGRPGDLVFVGSMDWMPNDDAMKWFLQEILPRVRRAQPVCRVGIVGRHPSSALRRLASQMGHIEVTGLVDDVRPWLWGSAVAIVPLRVGSGTRLKIYEAMAAGLPVVSTTLGAEGLELQPGRDFLQADRADDFAAACVSLLEDSERRRALGARGQQVARENSWERAAAVLEDELAGVMAQGNRRTT
jgi:glycosyltransferase involved in cell wall biosynthesis